MVWEKVLQGICVRQICCTLWIMRSLVCLNPGAATNCFDAPVWIMWKKARDAYLAGLSVLVTAVQHFANITGVLPTPANPTGGNHSILPFKLCITKTQQYYFDPHKPHFYKVKLGLIGVYIIFLISAQNIDCGYSLEPPHRGGSNEYL